MTASEAIEACNTLIWKCMFPPEKGFFMEPGSHQHTTMVKCFMAGLMVGEYGALGEDSDPSIQALHMELCAGDWQPDDRFRPTSHANN